jgi:transcriptional regulator with XRE-family HTH domain
MQLNYSKKLKAWRESKGITQSTLAKETGLKQPMISWWEAGKGLPNIEFCVILADYYQISVDELIGHDIKKQFLSTKTEERNDKL